MNNFRVLGFCFLLLFGCETPEQRELRRSLKKDTVTIPLVNNSVTIERKETFASRCSEIAFLAASPEEMRDGIDYCGEAIRRGVKSDMKLGNVHYNRGYLQFKLADYATAEQDFTLAIENNMSNLERGYYARGLCKQNTQRPREAAADFKKALEIRPDWRWAQAKQKEFWWVYGDEYPYD